MGKFGHGIVFHDVSTHRFIIHIIMALSIIVSLQLPVEIHAEVPPPQPKACLDVGHTERIGVHSIAFSPDGKLLASGSVTGAVRLWDVEVLRQVAVFEDLHPLHIFSLSFSPDGRWLVSGSWLKVHLLDLAEQRDIAVPEEYRSPVIFSPDGKLLASGSENGTVRLWNIVQKKESAVLKAEIIGTIYEGLEISSISFSPDGKLLALEYPDSPRLWDMSKQKEVARLERSTSEILTPVGFSHDGELLALASTDSSLWLWNVLEKEEATVLKGYTCEMNPNVNPTALVSFSPEDRLLAWAIGDDTVRIWNVAKKKEIAVLRGHKDLVSSVAFSPDGKLLASGSWDGTVLLWDASVVSGQPNIDR